MGVDPDRVAPMRLNPDLIEAYRRLGEADFLRFAPRRAVEYVIVESEHFRGMRWPTMPVVHTNPKFVALRVPSAQPEMSCADAPAARADASHEAGS